MKCVVPSFVCSFIPELTCQKFWTACGCFFFFWFLFSPVVECLGGHPCKNNWSDDEERIMVLGDFNGHIGFIGAQEININGKYIIQMMESFNLILLNGDAKCTGSTTREENGFKSTIDYIMINDSLYNNFRNIVIDEEKDLYDLSDHCLLNANFEFPKQYIKVTKESELIQYYCVKDSMKNPFHRKG